MEPGQIPNGVPNTPANMPPTSPAPQQPFQPTPYQTAPQQPSYGVPQQPAAAPQPAGPQGYQQTPMPMQPQPAYGMPTVMAPAPKSKKWLVIVIVVVLVAVLAASAAYFVLNKKSPQANSSSANTSSASGVTHSYGSSEDTAFAALKSGGSSLTSASLNAINKTDLFFSVFRNASEQPVVTTTYNSYLTPQLNGTPITSGESHIAFATQGGYDYKNSQFSFQANLDGSVEKCVNGTEYLAYTDDTSLAWAKDESGNSDCQIANTTAILNDGLNTGGLSVTQGQQFVDAIRDISGLVDVTNTSLVTQQGKQYIRIDATVNAKTDCYTNSVPSGVGCFGVAFNYLKLPKSWPDQTDATVVSGAHLAYFVDPATQLPAYMQIAYTPVTATQGNWQNQQMEYSFAPLATFQLVNGVPAPPTLTWPVTQLN